MVGSRRLNLGLWTGWVQAMHPQGVQEGVQKCGFVRGSRGARNPMFAPCQFRPATKLNVQLMNGRTTEGP